MISLSFDALVLGTNIKIPPPPPKKKLNLRFKPNMAKSFHNVALLDVRV